MKDKVVYTFVCGDLFHVGYIGATTVGIIVPFIIDK